MQTPETQGPCTIDCSGLSTALTLLRIKQAVAAPNATSPFSVAIDASCDVERLAESLGDLSGDIHLTVSEAA